MDDDLQHLPREIPRLLGELESNLKIDCVFGCFREKNHAAYRNFGSRILLWILRGSFGLPPGFRSSTFRVMRRQLVKAVLQHSTANPSLAVLIFSNTARVKCVDIEHAPRFAGKIELHARQTGSSVLDAILNISVLPLHAISYVGFASCSFSVLLVADVLYKYLTGNIGVAGWTTLVILTSLFAGVILLSLGVFGEYLVPDLARGRGVPPYIERERVGGWDTNEDPDEISP